VDRAARAAVADAQQVGARIPQARGVEAFEGAAHQIVSRQCGRQAAQARVEHGGQRSA
jgi:hypothetical protein